MNDRGPMKQAVTLAEICDVWGLADSSARRYVKTFKAFFPVASEGFPVRYRGEAVEIMGMIVAAMKERHSRAEIEAALAHAGHSRDVGKSSPPVFTTSPLPEIINESVVKMMVKSVAESFAAGQLEALEVNRRILATLEKQTAAIERQNELLEQLTRAEVALPRGTPSISLQEAPGGPEGTESTEPGSAAPKNASEGDSRPSWWKRLWKLKV